MLLFLERQVRFVSIQDEHRSFYFLLGELERLEDGVSLFVFLFWRCEPPLLVLILESACVCVSLGAHF